MVGLVTSLHERDGCASLVVWVLPQFISLSQFLVTALLTLAVGVSEAVSGVWRALTSQRK